MAHKSQANANLRAQVLHLAKAGIHLTTRQASIYVGLTEKTLETYRDIGKPPRYIKIAHHVRYPIQFLDEFLRATTPMCAVAGHVKLHGNNEMK